MSKIYKILAFAISNFGPLIVFYGTNHFYGLKPAIITSLLFTAIEVAYKLKKKEEITVFFKFCVATTVIFGAFDLYMQKSVLFKYEAALTNLIVAGFFGLSLRSGKSIIQEFAEKSSNASKYTIDHFFYFRVFTAVWTFYYIVKSAIYFWMASHYTLDEGFMIRVTAGNISDYVFIGVSVLGGRLFFNLMKKAKLLPSQRMR